MKCSGWPRLVPKEMEGECDLKEGPSKSKDEGTAGEKDFKHWGFISK